MAEVIAFLTSDLRSGITVFEPECKSNGMAACGIADFAWRAPPSSGLGGESLIREHGAEPSRHVR